VPLLPRRSFLKSLAGAAALGAAPPALAAGKGPAAAVLASRSPPDFQVLDLTVEGDKKLAQRFTLFIPNHLAKEERAPLLVLLHGLGETSAPDMGVFAWVERYGLASAYGRLRRPPLARTSRDATLLPDATLAALNTSLAAQPFRGMVIACPFTPNMPRAPNPSKAFDAYADWIADVVIPRARKEAPVLPDAAHTSLDGVSLGGYVGLEVFARRPDAFVAWGGVQAAFNVGRLPAYVDRLAAAAAKAPAALRKQGILHIETSVSDPMRDMNLALSTELKKKGVPHDFVVLPGQHDQVFLREAGTLEMLLWHDRRLRAVP
jgi:hypothetical protein